MKSPVKQQGDLRRKEPRKSDWKKSAITSLLRRLRRPRAGSKGHPEDTRACPVGEWVVLSSQPAQLELSAAESKFLENNSGKHPIV